MGKISSSLFFDAWMRTVNGRKEHMLSIWRQARPYTADVKGDEDSIMQEVAGKLGLLCYHHDYYSIDTVLSKEEDLVPGRPEGSYWFRNIRVAFEHENSFDSGLYQEIAHLLITNCDLRVLVTYPNREDITAELAYLHDVVSGSRNAGELSKDKSLLLILGYEHDFVWEGLVYETSGWERVS